MTENGKRLHCKNNLRGIVIGVVCLCAIAAGVVSAYYDIMGIFDHVFYLPVILLCFFYDRKGFLAALFVIAVYTLLIVFVLPVNETVNDIFIHVINFVLISFVVSYLSFKKNAASEKMQSLISMLIESESKFRVLLDESSDPVFSVSPEGNIIYFNRSFAAAAGVDMAKLAGENILNIFPGENREKQLELINEVLASGLKKTFEIEMPSAGGVKYFLVTLTPAKDRDGEIEYLVSFAKDITERKQAEAALVESEELNRIISGLTTDYAYIVDVSPAGEMTLRWISDNMEKYTGRKREDVEKITSWRGIFPDNEYEKFRSFTGKVLGTVEPGTLECRSLNAAGEVRWINIYASPVKRDDGGLTVFGAVKDISARKEAEEALNRFKFMVENAGQEVYLVEPDGKLVYVNQAAASSLGYTIDELLNIGVPGFDPEFGPVFREHFRKLKEHELPPFETVHIAKDGSRIIKEMHSVYISFNEKEYICGFGYNIMDKKRAEDEKRKLQEQLSQSQKMESVGRLAGGVAHDFNNMLGVIIGHAELALMETEPSGEVHNSLMEIEKAARRSADLTKQLLAFARKQAISPRVIDLNETISGMISMLRRLIGENIELAWLPGSPLWQIKIDPTQVDQILANLCVNARDAITGNGRISIQTSNVSLDSDWCDSHSGAVPGKYVMLSVSDTGSGFSRENLAHVFEPFFTTKETGKGTGLGLATVYGITRQNNGFIDVISAEGEGALFKIYFPRYSGGATAGREKTQAQGTESGNETILLVEDEPILLDMTLSMLKNLGYNVLATSSPSEAIRIAEQHGNQISLLITDVIMPDINGRDMSSRILEVLPHIKRLFMSGYTADVIAHHGVLNEEVHFIPKPFTIRELSASIRRALGNRKDVEGQ